MNKNLKDRADALLQRIYQDGYTHGYDEGIKQLENYVSLPVGHWVEVIDCETTLDGNPCTLSHYECSECKNINSDLGKYKYCPNCGARMESEVRNETDKP